MRKFFPVILMMSIVAGSVYAQTPGIYRGRTSQNLDIQFTVVGTCVDPMNFAANLTCPSGSTTGWSAFFGGCNPIQADGSFTVALAPVDGAIPTYLVSGQFTSETSAEGTIVFQASHLRFPGVTDPVEAQLCEAGSVTWTANTGAGPGQTLRFEGNQIITSIDESGKAATSYRLYSK